MPSIKKQWFSNSEIEFRGPVIGSETEKRSFRQKLPASKWVTAVTDYLDGARNVTTGSYQLRLDDIIVYFCDEDYHEAEVLSAHANNPLPSGARILAIYSQAERTVYSIWDKLEPYPGLYNVLNRIEMALGARGVYI